MKHIITLCIAMAIYASGLAQNTKNEVLQKVETSFTIDDWSPFEKRINTLNKNIAEHGILPFEEGNADLLTGYSYGEFYDWDLYFENLYLSYFGVSEYCFTNLKAFLNRQHLNGFVSRTLIEPRPYQHFKPFLAQTALLGCKQTGDYTWLNDKAAGAENTGPNTESLGIMNEKTYVNDRSYYVRLKYYLDHWLWFQDYDKNGLPVWNSSDHSGMDNQFRRSGSFNAFRYEGVDLACYIYRELKAMSILAAKLEKHDDVATFEKQATKLAEKINTYFWNEEDGFYYDRDERTGLPVKVKTVAGFIPLYTGIASDEQAERLVKEHLLIKEEFWTRYPIAAYAKSEPDYDQSAGDHGCNWRGTTWIPTNYMVFHGLRRYGYTDIAKELAQKTFDMVYRQNPTTREYFNGETGEGLGLDPFFGWSSLGYFMPFEFILKYDASALDDRPVPAIATEYLDLKFVE